jgi:GNAT superfamily N-acetyltransferase
MLELVTLRARPDLRPQLFAGALESLWPEFMQRDPTAMLYFADAHLDCYLDTAFAIIDPVAPDAAVGRAFAVPFMFEDLPDRTELPDAGWDGVIRWAHRDRTLGRTANALSALEITLLPERRGQGASRVILDAVYGFRPDRGAGRARAGARVAGAGPGGLCRTQRLGSSLDRLTAPGQRAHSITTVPTLSPRSTASCAAAA